jgi:hypothetical protein
MAYVRAKKIKRTSRKRRSGADSHPADQETYTYYQLVEGYREDGKVRQRVLAHLGRFSTPEEALEYWRRLRDAYAQRAAEHRRVADLIRSGSLQGHRSAWSRRAYLAPKMETEFDPETAPKPWQYRSFAPSGWFWHTVQIQGKGREDAAESAEREAQEHEETARKYAERVERLEQLDYYKNGREED